MHTGTRWLPWYGALSRTSSAANSPPERGLRRNSLPAVASVPVVRGTSGAPGGCVLESLRDANLGREMDSTQVARPRPNSSRRMREPAVPSATDLSTRPSEGTSPAATGDSLFGKEGGG